MATPVPRYVRVRQTDTGHQLDVPPSYLDDFPDAYSLVDDQERWPDLFDPNARPRPPKHNANLGSLAEDGARPDTGVTDGGDGGNQPATAQDGSAGVETDTATEGAEGASTNTRSTRTRTQKEG